MSFITWFCKSMDKWSDSQQNEREETKFSDVEFDIEYDVVYDEKVGDCCKLDTYKVKGLEGKLPVALIIHGGGFVAGDKYYRRAMSRWVATKGYYVVNINYGLGGPKYYFPEPIKHCVKALNWIGDNAEKYNFDLDKIVVMGDSAGAYMSCILTQITLNEKFQETYGKTSLKIAGAVLNCGIYDFNLSLKSFNAPQVKSLLKTVSNITKKDLPTYKYPELVDLTQSMVKEFPKCMLTYSKKDLMCGGQTQLMMKKMDEVGIEYYVCNSTKLLDNHCYSLSWTSKAARENNEKTAEFLEEIKLK